MSWHLFDRIRSLARSANIYQQERLFQDQSDLLRIMAGNELLNFNQQQMLLNQTNLQINRLERYKDYDQMDETGEMSLALDLYCLHGDTIIPLLDGTHPTIRELASKGIDAEFWVYAYDVTNGRYVPAKARNPHVSGRNAKMVEVLFDDGLTIKCTPNHKILTKKNGWVEAAKLSAGESVVPLYKTRKPPLSKLHDGLVNREYEFIQLEDQRWQATHQWVWEKLFGERKGVIHHCDLNKYNNSPENFKLMTWADHAELHRGLGKLTGEARESKRIKCSEAAKLKWQNSEYRCKMAPHCRNRGMQLNLSGKSFRRTAEYSVVTWDDLLNYINNGGDLGSVRKIAHNLGCAQRVILRLFERHNTNLVDFRMAAVGNHKVISVTPCESATEVYDIEVDGYNCFAAGTESSWIIVHNSDEASLVDPERKHTIVIKAKTHAVKHALEELFFSQLLIDNYVRPMVRYLCKYGDAPYEIVPTRDRDGVASLRFVNVYNFTRIETKKHYRQNTSNRFHHQQWL